MAKKPKAIKIDAADKLFSKLVRRRANWVCAKCGKQYPENAQGLHCSHLFGRRPRATRWNSLNAVAHCFSCHMYLTANPDLFSKWMREYHGDEIIDRLKLLHSTTITLKAHDLKDIHDDLEAQLKAQELGGDFETPAVILLAIQDAERRRAA